MTVRHDLEPIVHDWLHHTLDRIPDPTHRYGLVASEVNVTPQQRTRLPLPVPARYTMWSTTKSIVAISIVALFGSFLLASMLTTSQTEELLPATVPEPSAFPTGTFVSEDDDLTLELRPDGTCVRAGVPCTFGVYKNLFSEMAFEDPSGAQVPATYYWDFDGERLTFESWGIDKRPDRHTFFADHAYEPIGETHPLPVIETDFPTGRFVPADGSGSPSLWIRDDGSISTDTGGGAKYVVVGDLFTEATFNPGQSNFELVPATYNWLWDGKRLQLRLWGEDTNRWRTAAYDGHVFVRDETWTPPDEKRRLLLSDPRIDVWVVVEISKLDDGRYAAIATLDEDRLGEGTGETQQEAVRAALEPLGEPYASDIADRLPR